MNARTIRSAAPLSIIAFPAIAARAMTIPIVPAVRPKPSATRAIFTAGSPGASRPTTIAAVTSARNAFRRSPRRPSRIAVIPTSRISHGGMGATRLKERAGLDGPPRARPAVTIPYFEFREVLAVRSQDRDRVHGLADLRGRRVATLGATIAYDLLLAGRESTGVIPVSYDDDVHPYSDLVAERVDAVLLDHIIAQRALRRRGGTGFVILPQPVAVGHYVGVLARADSVLRDSVDGVLREAMRDGTLEHIFRRWGVWDVSQSALFDRILRSGAITPTAGPSPAPAPVPAARAVTAYFPSLARAAGVTAVISVLSMALAVAVGLGLASGRLYGPGGLRAATTVYIEVVRGTPVLLQLFVIYYGLAGVVRLPAFLAAVLGLGLNYAAYEAEIYRGALQAVSSTQLEAARTLGFSEAQILRLVRGPQALRYALAPMTNDFVALLKDSSLVSVITVVELPKQTAIYATNVGSWIVPGPLCAVV